MAERYCAENLVFRAGQRTLINDVSLTLSQGELATLNLRADGAAWRAHRLRSGSRTGSPATGR